MKYRIGDRVIVREDLEYHTRYYMDDGESRNVVIKYMMDFRGEVCTIRDIDLNQYRLYHDATGFDMDCLWTDEMLRPYEPAVEYDLDSMDLDDLFGGGS